MAGGMEHVPVLTAQPKRIAIGQGTVGDHRFGVAVHATLHPGQAHQYLRRDTGPTHHFPVEGQQPCISTADQPGEIRNVGQHLRARNTRQFRRQTTVVGVSVSEDDAPQVGHAVATPG